MVLLEKGKSYTAFVTDVNFFAGRELTIWAQIGENAEDLLNDITATLHEESYQAQPLTNIQIGSMCSCKYVEDQQWYRACIIKSSSDGKWVARFIDYGNSQAFEEIEFFQLPDKLQQIPPLATALFLSESIVPLNSADLWTYSTAKILLDFLLYSEIDIQVLKVFDKRVQVMCQTINDVLITKGLAHLEKCSFPYCDFPIGRTFKGYVAFSTEYGSLLMQEESSAAKLDKMMDDIVEYYSADANKVALLKDQIAPGALVAAMYNSDQHFYRAQVVDVDMNLCTVYYIDYGNTETQEITTLCELPQKFCVLPYQAIECELFNIEIVDAKRGDALKDYLLSRTDGQVVNFEVQNHIYPSTTRLSVTATCAGENLSTLLVAKGYAKLCRIDAEPLEYKFEELELGSQLEMYISHVEPNGTFYVSKMSEAAKLDKLMDELIDYCASAKDVARLSVGLPCCALYDQDNSWYRAVIKSITGEDCEVMYVDYGNSSNCNISSLKKISKSHVSLPCQAIECLILRQLTDDEITLLQGLLGEMIEVKFLKRADNINSFYVKSLHDGKVLFPPLVKKESNVPVYQNLEIKLGSTEKVKILSLVSLTDMWGRLSSCEIKLQELCSDLNKIYNHNVDAHKFDSRIEIGALCVVYDTEYNQWCRGKVVTVKSSSIYSVLLVDVGISKDYAKSRLRQIVSKQFLEFPCQAIHFTLSETAAILGSKLDQSSLSLLFLDKTFQVKFVSYDKVNNVYCIDMCDENDKTVEKLLLLAENQPETNENAVTSHEHITKLQAAASVPLNDAFVEVAVCFVEDPDCMWLQLQSNAHKLFRLINDMQTFYNQLPSNVLIYQQPQYDNLCAVRVKNQSSENWYRGRILCLYADVIEIKLIDFGSEVKVKHRDIKMLSSNFSHPEAQALRCKLYNVLPVSKGWANKAVRELTRLANESTCITAKFVERQKSSYVVDLEVVFGGKRIMVNDFLVKQGIATWLNADCAPDTETTELVDVDVTLQSINSSHSSVIAPKPKLFYQSPGVAFVGAEVEVFASEVISPNDFFLQINDACHRQKYAALIRDLNVSCNNNDISLLCEEDFYIGLPCAVFYDRVQQWCRGAILNFKDLECLQICLVDYGCIIVCPLDEVKAIDSKLVKQAPPEAMRCTLQGVVSPKHGSWSSEANQVCSEFFESDQRNLICTVHACAGNDLCTYFICSVKTPLRNLADDLIKSNLAVKTPVMGKVSPPLKLKSFIYSNLGEIKGKEDVFYVTHVEAPNLFYCQLSNNFSIIDSMMDKLQLHCNESDSEVTVEELIQDCMCFARYLGKWYRAHFVSTGPESHVKVLFVDYGNTEMVHLSDVRKFANDVFYELPIQALPCSLKDIDVALTSAEQQQTSLLLMKSILVEREFHGIVIGSTNGKLHLDLFHDGKRINKVMVKKAILDEPHTQKEENSDLYHTPEESSNKIALIEPYFLREGAEESVTMASCINAQEFYLWLNKLDEERNTCMNSIDGLYTAMRNADYKLESLCIGDIICARRTKDMKWCRAKVLSLTSSEVEVFYLDTGEKDTVLRAYDVKQLILKMGKWPKMAVPCSLTDATSSAKQEWSSKALFEFQYFIRNSQLTAHFMYKDKNTDKWMVKLCKGDVDFMTHLKNLGVALHSGESLQSSSASGASSKNAVAVELPNIWQGEKETFISHVLSDSEIFVQGIDALTAVEELKDVISADQNLQQLTKSPEILDFCLARFDEDDQLYRAQVLSCASPDVYKVHFVDYGNDATVKLSDLFILPEKYAQVPQAAVRCKLNSMPPALPSSELISKLENLSLVENIILSASFTQQDFGDSNIIHIRVQQADGTKVVALELYLVDEDCFEQADGEKTSVVKSDSNQLRYNEIEDILNQASRSIYISHVENPGHVFCQLSEFCDELDTLMNSVESYYQVEHPEDKVESTAALPIGSPCVAKYSADNAWYRAAVEEVVDPDQLRVRFVDYGNSQLLALSEIRKSKIGFCTLPIQAIHCYVALVDHNPESWTDDEVIEYDNRVATLQLKATFTRVIDEKKSIYELMLRLPDETLLNKEYMKSTTSSSQANEVSDVVCQDEVHEPLPKALTINEENLSLKELSIELGSLKDCYVSYAENISNFHLQLAGSENDLNSLYTMALADAQANPDVQSNLKPEDMFSGDSVCVAKSSEDGEWYRGIIKKVGSKATVFFADYGNCSTIEWSCVKRISAKTATLPLQAITCSLSGLSALSLEVQDEAICTFFDLVEGQLLKVSFLEKVDSIWVVSIVVDGVNVADKILMNIRKKYPDLSTTVESSLATFPNAGTEPALHVPTTPSAESATEQSRFNKAEALVQYNELIFKQIKDMLTQSSPAEAVLSLIDDALIKINKFHSLVRDSDSEKKTDDDLKRPFSEFLSIPAPCKKPRLDKRNLSTSGSVSTLQSIEEQDEGESGAASSPRLSTLDVRKSSVCEIETPDCFYIRPDIFAVPLPHVGCAQLDELKEIENDMLCAYKTDEKDDTTVKRGCIVGRTNETAVSVLDMDSGYKCLVEPDSVYVYPEKWRCAKPSVVCCSLHGISPVASQWSVEACEFFIEKINSAKKNVLVKLVKETESESPVSTWSIECSVEGVDISSLLVENNYAVKAIDASSSDDLDSTGDGGDRKVVHDDDNHSDTCSNVADGDVAIVDVQATDDGNEEYNQLQESTTDDVSTQSSADNRMAGFVNLLASDASAAVENPSEEVECDQESSSPPQSSVSLDLSLQQEAPIDEDERTEADLEPHPSSSSFPADDEAPLDSIVHSSFESEFIDDDAVQRVPSFVSLTGAALLGDLSQTVQPESQTEHPESQTEQPESQTDQPESQTEQPEPQFEQPELQTEQPESQFEQPESQFEQPESQFEQPESQFDQPESQTDQPESQTDQPESQTDQPESQTEQPESQTEQPESQTEQPESQTKQPESQTEQPESQTEQPESQTEQPESQTEQPESQTEQPESQTEQPESQTEQPESQTEQPESQTEQPESQTEQPESQTEQPESQTEQPESQTEQPESQTEQPESQTEQPESQTEQPESAAIETIDDFTVDLKDPPTACKVIGDERVEEEISLLSLDEVEIEDDNRPENSCETSLQNDPLGRVTDGGEDSGTLNEPALIDADDMTTTPGANELLESEDNGKIESTDSDSANSSESGDFKLNEPLTTDQSGSVVADDDHITGQSGSVIADVNSLDTQAEVDADNGSPVIEVFQSSQETHSDQPETQVEPSKVHVAVTISCDVAAIPLSSTSNVETAVSDQLGSDQPSPAIDSAVLSTVESRDLDADFLADGDHADSALLDETACEYSTPRNDLSAGDMTDGDEFATPGNLEWTLEATESGDGTPLKWKDAIFAATSAPNEPVEGEFAKDGADIVNAPEDDALLSSDLAQTDNDERFFDAQSLPKTCQQ